MSWRRGEQTVYLRGLVSGGLRVPTLEDEEGKRLNTQHRFLAAVAGKRHYFAPVKNPKTILDVASATGIWGVDMALHFKQAIVDNLDSNEDMGKQWLGVLTARRPDLRNRLRFLAANALRPLPFDDNTYDFTHGRFLEVFVPYSDWPRVVAEMVRVTKPGKPIELVGGEYPELDTPAFTALRRAVIRFLGSLHLHLNASTHFAEFLEEAGAEVIGKEVLRVGARPSERIKLADNFVAAAQALRIPLVAAGLLPPDRFDTLLPQFHQEIVESDLMWRVRACWGRKPPVEERPTP